MEILSQDTVSYLPALLPGSDYHVRLPDGRYVVKYVGAEGFHYFRDLRVVMWFSITEGKFSGTMIPAYYNVQARGDVPKGRFRSPKFTVGQKSKLARDLGTLFTRFSPARLPVSIPEREMEQNAILVQSGTVKKDADGFSIPKAFRSSKIIRLVGWANQC